MELTEEVGHVHEVGVCLARSVYARPLHAPVSIAWWLMLLLVGDTNLGSGRPLEPGASILATCC